jgi:hypothetical protein
MLFIIMVIWRPSANKLRFAYTQVLNGDSEEEEEEQGVNKNFGEFLICITGTIKNFERLISCGY